LHEEFTLKSLIGCTLIGLGTLIMVLWLPVCQEDKQ
jgi:hypothetical protein